LERLMKIFDSFQSARIDALDYCSPFTIAWLS